MTANDDVKTLKTFAAEHGLQRQTVGDIVAIHNLPCQKIGRAKMVTPKTQKAILRILGIKPGRTPVTAA